MAQKKIGETEKKAILLEKEIWYVIIIFVLSLSKTKSQKKYFVFSKKKKKCRLVRHPMPFVIESLIVVTLLLLVYENI